MDDEMIDLIAGDVRLRRRLEAYADARLSPDLAATARIRARVLVHAHRQADLAGADAALTIVPRATSRHAQDATVRVTREPNRSGRWRRPLAAVAAAALALSVVGGAAAAAHPGGALYDARLWLEVVTLPAEPSERAVAELRRLEQRLREADEATRNGDAAGAAAALAAYERIMDQASAAALATGDPVAAAVLETGVGRNLVVLEGLVGRLPTQASDAVERAIERAIERSGTTIDRVDDVKPPRHGGNGPPTDPTAKPTTRPGAEPDSKPTKAPTVNPNKPTKPSPKTDPGRVPDKDKR
jgi:ribosomal protein S11